MSNNKKKKKNYYQGSNKPVEVAPPPKWLKWGSALIPAIGGGLFAFLIGTPIGNYFKINDLILLIVYTVLFFSAYSLLGKMMKSIAQKYESKR